MGEHLIFLTPILHDTILVRVVVQNKNSKNMHTTIHQHINTKLLILSRKIFSIYKGGTSRSLHGIMLIANYC